MLQCRDLGSEYEQPKLEGCKDSNINVLNVKNPSDSSIWEIKTPLFQYLGKPGALRDSSAQRDITTSTHISRGAVSGLIRLESS